MIHHPTRAWLFTASVVTASLCSLAVFGRDDSKAKPPSTEPAAPAATPEKSQEPAKPLDGAPALKAGNLSDPADLEAFFDGAIKVQLGSKHIAGAVVAVVVGDKVAFTKGYGYADVEARKKVDPEKTLFRIASISKLFTWTAVMQQVEEGKLDLDKDVNTYMKDFQIPATYDQPVTVKSLLTHTPGFDDYVLGLFAHKADGVGPLAEVLKKQLPTRVRPPGVLSSYSNHGTAMAGYAVACVSGMPWEDYVEQRILKPLGMEHTLVRQPEEAKLPADMSKGYKWDKGDFKSQDFEYCPAAPAGCISTTAADAARFMLAHLHDGQHGGGRILKPETAKQMREPLFRNDPKVDAMCYGFWELSRNGQRLVGHGGDTIWFHSLMELIPDRKVGLFVSYNTDTSGGAREELLNAFLGRYFPVADPPVVKPASDFHERAKDFAGEYGITRYSHSTVTKLAALMGAIKVSVNDDDTLTIGRGDRSGRFVEVEPLVFREIDGPRKVVFKKDDKGRITNLFLSEVPAVSTIRRDWYELTPVQFGLLGGSVAVFLSALLYWPVLAFAGRGLESARIRRTWFSAFLSCLAWISCAVCVGLLVGIGLAMQDPNEIAFGLTPALKGLLTVPQICAGLAGLSVLGALVAWRNRYWRLSGRLHYTLVALAGVAFTAFLYYWNLLSFGFEGLEGLWK
jgi:CubicO group peptidase (beta-lactamase class C family)